MFPGARMDIDCKMGYHGVDIMEWYWMVWYGTGQRSVGYIQRLTYCIFDSSKRWTYPLQLRTTATATATTLASLLGSRYAVTNAGRLKSHDSQKCLNGLL